jgi:hypothetical protein
VQQSEDPYLQRLYHSPACPDRVRRAREMRQQGELPAEMALLTGPSYRAADPPSSSAVLRTRVAQQPASSVPGGHPASGSRVLRPAGRAMRRATGVSPGRARNRSNAVGLIVGASVVAIAAALVSGLLAARASPPAAGRSHAPAAVGQFPTFLPSPQSVAPSSGRLPSHQPAGSPQATAPTPPPGSVLITFADGTDGWSPFWGSITGTPATSPAIDGASLLLTASADRFTAVGTTTDVAQLTTGDTVTYHVWSSGQPGSLRPFIQTDTFVIDFAGSRDTPLPSSPGWFTLTWPVPPASSVKGIGLQVINPGTDSLTLAIGALWWPQS